jgi:hypothetical protein
MAAISIVKEKATTRSGSAPSPKDISRSTPNLIASHGERDHEAGRDRSQILAAGPARRISKRRGDPGVIRTRGLRFRNLI